ncbi:YbjQ family protein [Segatella bryantii]|jgi:uncharacterized protein YbjQ (UPF0145 family)|uniref:heavy metal-binding domain-containing protein n=1 Tax=Segatella bryantii TaxID=77095 RepID=UPI00088CE8B3|nr:heavy metal-binding domain-containing protein [Segatella bryantii]UKK72010.1 YbjQ family protein [Segatella bryantii]SDL94313.1 Uncharacterized conserved protein YbjQ, UPF0145 family [Segatella bryantii]
MTKVLTTASDHIEGYKITALGGVAMATSVSIHYDSSISTAMSALSSLFQGSDEVNGEEIQDTYAHAVNKLINTATKNNCNAIINLKFDSISLPNQQKDGSTYIAVTAYGNICKIKKA